MPNDPVCPVDTWGISPVGPNGSTPGILGMFPVVAMGLVGLSVGLGDTGPASHPGGCGGLVLQMRVLFSRGATAPDSSSRTGAALAPCGRFHVRAVAAPRQYSARIPPLGRTRH